MVGAPGVISQLNIFWQMQITFLDHKLELSEAEISYSCIMDNT